LDFIIKKVCCLNDTVKNLDLTGGAGYVEPNVSLPTCLQYTDPTTGQTVTQLQHSVFTLKLANSYCSLKATVDTHTTQLTTLGTRITALESAGGISLPTVVPNCLLTPGTPVQMNVLLDELEAQYCNLRAVLGTNAGITSAIAQQCSNLGNQNALSQAGYVSGLTGWVPASGDALSGTLAGAVKNLWTVLCDMRAAIYDLKNTAGQTDCSAFILGFTAAANSDRTQVTLFFQGTTVVPAGFANCTQQGSKVTIADTSGHTYTGYVDLVAAQTNASGVAFTVSGASLNTSQAYTVTVFGCVSKSGSTCSKEAKQTVSVPCPIISSVTATLV
jgi:hypothetical protein